MGGSDSPDPVGSGEYVVQQGECLASIAYENGLLPDTLWNHPKNASLKAGRKDPNILMPGDRVYIPEVREREESCATDGTYIFQLSQPTEMLRVVLLDSDGNPRKSLQYTIKLKGSKPKSGRTGADGVVKVPILPNTREAELVVQSDLGEETYELYLGAIDPPTTLTGIQARLNNLGYFCGEVDGLMGPLTAGALQRFQKNQNLTANGKLDGNTRDALVKQHGF